MYNKIKNKLSKESMLTYVISVDSNWVRFKMDRAWDWVQRRKLSLLIESKKSPTLTEPSWSKAPPSLTSVTITPLFSSPVHSTEIPVKQSTFTIETESVYS